MTFQPAQSLMKMLQSLEFNETLNYGNPRFVDTQQVRGSEQIRRCLARKLGQDPETDVFFPATTKHVLLFGHTGSGRATELRQYLDRFIASGHYLPVEVDVLTLLDSNNLVYNEVLMTMVERPLQELETKGIEVPDTSLKPIQEWFVSNTRVMEMFAEAGVGTETSVGSGGGLPGLFRLIPRVTSSFKAGASTKGAMRIEVRNRFTQFVGAFNALIRSAGKPLDGRRIVFLIDGMGKLRGKDVEDFFIYDAGQLLTIATLAIYTAPLQLKRDGRIGDELDADPILPTIKLYERTTMRCEVGWVATREILLRWTDGALFESDEAIWLLVEHSGGRPCKLLHLLRLCCELAPGEVTDHTTTQATVDRLTTDCRRRLTLEDYTLLCEIDRTPEHDGSDERAQRLLYRLAFMEYNDKSWYYSHPVVRTLEGHVRAATQ